MTPADLLSWQQTLGLNNRQLADYLGVTPPCISQWLSGKYPIPTLAVNCINALKIIEELQQPKLPLPVPPGKCACRCGGDTVKNWRTDNSKGWIKGEYRAYISGHNIKAEKVQK